MLRLIRKYKSNRRKSNLIELGLIDNRNNGLWEEINSNISVNYIFSDYPNYAVQSSGNKSKVIIPENNLNINSFSHELLHILLRSKSIYAGSCIENSIAGDQALSKLLSYELVEHIGNCLDHIKMLPIYLELGFEKEEFIVDYDEDKFSWSELSKLKSVYRINGLLNPEAIDFYIGKYFSVKADPDVKDHYTEMLNELSQMDIELYHLLQELVNDWIKMPISSINTLDDTYHSVIFRFVDGLKAWKDQKQFMFN